jgi:hypothetical protein
LAHSRGRARLRGPGTPVPATTVGIHPFQAREAHAERHHQMVANQHSWDGGPPLTNSGDGGPPLTDADRVEGCAETGPAPLLPLTAEGGLPPRSARYRPSPSLAASRSSS